jgi:hypothetical protein
MVSGRQQNWVTDASSGVGVRYEWGGVCCGHRKRKITNFTFISPRIVINFFTIKPTDALISYFILVRNSTYFGQFLCPSSGVIHCILGTSTYCTGLMTACLQDQDGTALLQWKTVSITYYKHTFVAIVIQLSSGMSHIVTCDLHGTAVPSWSCTQAVIKPV